MLFDLTNFPILYKSIELIPYITEDDSNMSQKVLKEVSSTNYDYVIILALPSTGYVLTSNGLVYVTEYVLIIST